MGSSDRVRNIRRRSDDHDNAIDNDEDKTIAPPKPKKPKLLSFADDESTGIIIPISRLSSNHKLRSAKEWKKLTPSSIRSNVQPQAGVYTKEALLELQNNTKTLGRPSERERGTIHINNLLSNNEIDDDTNIDSDDNVDDETMNQAMVNAIRAKRESFRQSRAPASELIALDTGSYHWEEPEYQGRIALIGQPGNIIKGVFEDASDEEDDMWEEEQVRKGLSCVTSTVQSVDQRVVHSTVAPVSLFPAVGGPSIGGSVGCLSGSETVSIRQQGEFCMKALHGSIARLKEAHGRTLKSLTKTEENLSDSSTKVTALENALAAAGEKVIFMRKLRNHVSAKCDVLQDKTPFIEELDQMQNLHKQCAEAILERRTADIKQIELEAFVNAAMALSNKGAPPHPWLNQPVVPLRLCGPLHENQKSDLNVIK